MAYDRYRHQVVSLLHFDGANNSTAFVDETGRTWAAAGGAKIITDVSQFGSAAGDFTAAGARISTARFSENLLAQPFALEGYIAVAAYGGDNIGRPLMLGEGLATPGAYNWGLGPNSSGKLTFFYWGGSAINTTGSTTIPLNTRTHVAVSYDGLKIRVFLDGILDGQLTRTADPAFSTSVVSTFVGFQGYGGAGSTCRFKADEFRFTVGQPRYVSDFDVPIGPFTLRGTHVSGTVKKGDPATPVTRKIILLRSLDQVIVGSGESDPDSGGYEIETAADVDEALIGMVYPDYGEPWIKSHVYALDARTWVGEPAPLGHWYECEQAGTTGSTAPTWPTDGSTVTDGTVIWRDKGVMERPWAEGPYIAEAV